MADIKAGVVCVTKFCRAGNKEFQAYIDYIDREEAARTEHSNEYNLYADYMGNPEKTTGLFTSEKNNLNPERKEIVEGTVFESAGERFFDVADCSFI